MASQFGVITTLANDLKAALDRLADKENHPSRKAITVQGTKGSGITNKLWEDKLYSEELVIDLGLKDAFATALPIQENLKKETPYKELFEEWKDFVDNQGGKARQIEHLVALASIRFKPYYQEFIRRLQAAGIGLLHGEAGYHVVAGDPSERKKVVDRLYP